MSKKRFTDVDIWKKPWFRKLTPAEKTAWAFVKDQCDNVGVWDADYEIANIYIGESIDWEVFREKLNGNVEVLESGKWWLEDFCTFQYGELSEGCIPHQSYIKLLKSHGLFQRVAEGYGKGTERVCNTPKDKDKEEDKDKEKEKKPIRKKPPSDYRSLEAIAYWANYSSKHSSIGGNDYPPWFDKMWEVYPARNGKKAGKYLAFKAVFQIAESFGELRLIYNAVCDYAESCGDYAKDMHRFLANDFWRDFLFAESWPEHLTAYKAKYSLDEAKQLYSEGTKP